MGPAIAQGFISSARRIRQSLRNGHILLIDDDASITQLLESLCKALGETTRTVSDIDSARWHILEHTKSIKVAVIDYSLKGVFADELVLLCSENNIPCIIHTGHMDKLPYLKEKFPDIIVITKPSPIERLIKELV